MHMEDRMMHRITIFISRPQYLGFRKLAKSQGRPYAELVREALQKYLDTPKAAR